VIIHKSLILSHSEPPEATSPTVTMGKPRREPRADLTHHVFATRGSLWLRTNCLF